jgi:hypothetical protein
MSVPQRRIVSVTSPLTQFHARLLTSRLDWFNADVARAHLLREFLTPLRSGAPSLRLVDHLVVQYAREQTIAVPGEAGVPIDLWSFYRRMLSSIGKKYFDVFKRRYPLDLCIDGVDVVATIGQVIFFQVRSKPVVHNLTGCARRTQSGVLSREPRVTSTRRTVRVPVVQCASPSYSERPRRTVSVPVVRNLTGCA